MAKSIKKAKAYPLYEEGGGSVVEEPAMHYETMRVILGGDKIITQPIGGELDLINLSRKGVRKSSLKSLSNYLGITMDHMSDLLHTSHRTIQRKDDNELLDVYKSEQTIEVAEVVSKGLDIFRSKEKLQQWLHTSILALGNRKPIEFLDTSFGVKLVYRALSRLEYGVYS
jgi:putative toxin-antitoxin system antitoxin component (TIGR02293 family)